MIAFNSQNLPYVKTHLKKGDIGIVRERLGLKYTTVWNTVNGVRPNHKHKDKIMTEFLKLFAERAELEKAQTELIKKIDQLNTGI